MVEHRIDTIARHVNSQTSAQGLSECRHGRWISDYSTSPNVDPLLELFAKYDLHRHVVELEAYGMTVVPPEKMQWSPGFVDRLRHAMLMACEKRNGISLGDYRTSKGSPRMGANSWHLLEEDEVFVEAATNPVQLALVRWLCGQSAMLGGQTWIIKAADPSGGLGLHSDSHGLPPGSGSGIAHMCNSSILCTDYNDAEDGPTCFVPGSHKFGRATFPHEAAGTGYKMFPLQGKAGSLAIWNGAVWHGSMPRTRPGLRITLVQNFFRTYMRPQCLYDRVTAPELLEKYPELAQIVGSKTALYPYENPMNPKLDRVAPFIMTGTDPFA